MTILKSHASWGTTGTGTFSTEMPVPDPALHPSTGLAAATPALAGLPRGNPRRRAPWESYSGQTVLKVPAPQVPHAPKVHPSGSSQQIERTPA